MEALSEESASTELFLKLFAPKGPDFLYSVPAGEIAILPKGADFHQVSLGAGEVGGVLRGQDQDIAFPFQPEQLLPALVVPLCPGGEGVQKGGVLRIELSQDGHELFRLFYIGSLPGQQHHYPVAAHLKGPLPGNGVRTAAVQIGLTIQMVDGEHDWQGAGGLQKLVGPVPAGDGHILRQAGVQIGDNGLGLAGIGLKGVVVIGLQLVRNGLIGELQAKIRVISRQKIDNMK